MFELLGIPPQALFGQLLLGLINGSFYAILSLGLAVIFGLLNIINFAHGAQYMLGAFVAWMLLNYFGIGYWWALLLVPVIVGAFGIVLERLMIARLYHLDHLYGLLLTFGLYREPNRYDLHCEPFADRVVLPRKTRQASLEAIVQQFADRLEHYCRLAPDNWFNFFDFWHDA